MPQDGTDAGHSKNTNRATEDRREDALNLELCISFSIMATKPLALPRVLLLVRWQCGPW